MRDDEYARMLLALKLAEDDYADAQRAWHDKSPRAGIEVVNSIHERMRRAGIRVDELRAKARALLGDN